MIVSQGYYRDVCIPARYEDRSVQYWVPSYERSYVTVPSYGGGYYGHGGYGYSRPSYGSSFNFSYRR